MTANFATIQAGTQHWLQDLTPNGSLTAASPIGPWVEIPVCNPSCGNLVGGVHTFLDATAGATAKVCLDYSNDAFTVAPVQQAWTSDPAGAYNNGLTELQASSTGAGCVPQIGFAFMRLRRMDSGTGNLDGHVSWNQHK